VSHRSFPLLVVSPMQLTAPCAIYVGVRVTYFLLLAKGMARERATLRKSTESTRSHNLNLSTARMTCLLFVNARHGAAHSLIAQAIPCRHVSHKSLSVHFVHRQLHIALNPIHSAVPFALSPREQALRGLPIRSGKRENNPQRQRITYRILSSLSSSIRLFS
jgi:hypothetical protein